ncbi:MAG: PfkB family carbohydrate kinase [Candidatus Nanohalobium sp.]
MIKTDSAGVQIHEKRVPSPEVENVVDTTAAGDTFNGYLAAELADNQNLEDAAQKACIAASKTVQEKGAQASIPKI